MNKVGAENPASIRRFTNCSDITVYQVVAFVGRHGGLEDEDTTDMVVHRTIVADACT